MTSSSTCTTCAASQRPTTLTSRGTVHVQLDSRRADAERQKSYLVRADSSVPLIPQVDSTKRMLDWVHERGAAIIDVNVLPKPPVAGVRPSRDPDRIMERRLAEHVWDTIVECVTASRVLSDGAGCPTPGASCSWARAWRARP